jgi:hypothetical protein
MSGPGETGRHSKYSPLFPAVARERYLRGDTHAQVADLFGVSPRTVMRWTVEHPEYREAFHEGRNAAAEFRISQMPAHAPLFPQPAPASEPGPGAAGHGEPVTRVIRRYVAPTDLRDR